MRAPGLKKYSQPISRPDVVKRRLNQALSVLCFILDCVSCFQCGPLCSLCSVSLLFRFGCQQRCKVSEMAYNVLTGTLNRLITRSRLPARTGRFLILTPLQSGLCGESHTVAGAVVRGGECRAECGTASVRPISFRFRASAGESKSSRLGTNESLYWPAGCVNRCSARQSVPACLRPN